MSNPEFPPGMTGEDANKCIVNAEHNIFNGTERTGRPKLKTLKCHRCGVNRRASFKNCPFCELRSAKKVDLQNSDEPVSTEPYIYSKWERLKMSANEGLRWAGLSIVCIGVFSLLSVGMYFVGWLFWNKVL